MRSIIDFHANQRIPMLSFSECLVCVCVLFIYTISISILCVLREELSLIKSNQQVCDFYK